MKAAKRAPVPSGLLDGGAANDQNKTPARVGTGAIKVILWAKSTGIASHRRNRRFRRISMP